MRLRPEQKSYTLFRELVSWYSHPWDPVMGLTLGTFSAAESSFNVQGHHVFVDCRVNPDYFRPGEATVLRELGTAAVQARRDVQLT